MVLMVRQDKLQKEELYCNHKVGGKFTIVLITDVKKIKSYFSLSFFFLFYFSLYFFLSFLALLASSLITLFFFCFTVYQFLSSFKNTFNKNYMKKINSTVFYQFKNRQITVTLNLVSLVLGCLLETHFINKYLQTTTDFISD